MLISSQCDICKVVTTEMILQQIIYNHVHTKVIPTYKSDNSLQHYRINGWNVEVVLKYLSHMICIA